MNKTIDCLFIGHNEMDFEVYENYIRRMGVHSGAYRDLNLNFVWYRNKPSTVPEIFNLFYYNDDFSKGPVKPLHMGETFSAAISYLGTYLNRSGFTFDFVNTFQFEKDQLAEKLQQDDILTIGIITTYYMFALPIHEIIEFIRKYNQTAKILVGGPFIFSQVRTQEPAVVKYLFESLGADIYVYSSQGEATLVEILKALKNNLSLDRINNIYYKTTNGYMNTPVLKEDNKLSENMVNWSLFSHRVSEYVDLRTAISCPFSCAFCGSREHAGKYQTLGVEEIESELNQLAKIESIKGLSFIDDTFNVPIERFKNILRMIKKNKFKSKFKWISNLRCQFADREMVELMKECDCQGVFLGIESGNNQVLKNMNKVASVEEYLKGVALLKEYEIMSFGSFIVGFPGETEETVEDTIKFIKETGIDFFRAHLWYFEPITPIWRAREKYGLVGQSFEWQHKTMDSKTACDLIDHMFLSIEEPVWVTQYNFDFDHLWRLTQRGMDKKQISDFLKSFNQGIKQRLLNPSQKEINPSVVQELKKACKKSDNPDNPDHQMYLTEDYGVKFNF